MANILEYLIKLKADGSMVNTATNQVINQLGRIDRAADKVGRSLQEAFSFKNLKSSLMSLPGMEFLMNPYVAIAAGVGVVTKLGAEAEMTSVSFAKLVGDEKKAADTLAQIKEYANVTPYESMDLVESAKQMLSFGVSTEKTVGMMKRLGDISMGDKNKMQSLSLVYSQVASQGKLMGQDFMQFVNAGFNPIQELADMTGKTTAELKDMMSKGQIGERAVAAAIEHATEVGGKFYGMSGKLAETTAGQFSTLVGKLKESASKLFEALQPLINVLMEAGMVIIEDLAGGIKVAVEWTNKFKRDFQPFLQMIGKAASLIWNLNKNVIRFVYSALGDMLRGFGKLYDILSSIFGLKSEGSGRRMVWKASDGKVFDNQKEAIQYEKDIHKNKISNPRLIGSLFESPSSTGKGTKGKGAKSKDANAIATGGTRNTQITMTISKMIESFNVAMTDKTDTAEMEALVVQTLNRALAIATSTDR